jgi:hypothetical protein
MKQHETKHQKTSKVQCKTMLCDAHWVTFDTLRLCSSRNHRGARGWESWARNQDRQPCDIDTDATMWHWMWYSFGLDWFGMDSLRLEIWYLSNSFDTFWQEVWNRFLCSLSHESAQSRYHLEGQGWGGNVGMWRHKVKSHNVGTVGMYFNSMYFILFIYYIFYVFFFEIFYESASYARVQVGVSVSRTQARWPSRALEVRWVWVWLEAQASRQRTEIQMPFESFDSD